MNIKNVTIGYQPKYHLVKKDGVFEMIENPDYVEPVPIIDSEPEEVDMTGAVSIKMATGEASFYSEDGLVTMKHGDAVIYTPAKRWFDMFVNAGDAKINIPNFIGQDPVFVMVKNTMMPTDWIAYDPLNLMPESCLIKRTLDCKFVDDRIHIDCTSIANDQGAGEFFVYLFGESAIPILKHTFATSVSFSSMDIQRSTQTAIVRGGDLFGEKK